MEKIKNIVPFFIIIFPLIYSNLTLDHFLTIRFLSLSLIVLLIFFIKGKKLINYSILKIQLFYV